MSDAADKKADLRRKISAQRKIAHQRFDENKIDFSLIATKIMAISDWARPKIAVYNAIYSEFNLDVLRQELQSLAAMILMPVTHKLDNPLIFREFLGEDKMSLDLYKIPCPDESCGIYDPDIILMPLMGFDLLGNRLGYGGGFYDRSLDQLENRQINVIKIACAYDVQEVEQVPTDKNDQKFDYLLTPSRFIKIDN